MKNIRKILDDLYYIGCQDRRLALFENVYPIPLGASFNSYLLNDEKTVLFDTVDKNCAASFFDNLKAALNNKPLDYIVINHIEPDHSALIKDVIDCYSNIKIVCNQKTKSMLNQFFDFESDIEDKFHIVKEGDTLNTGSHELTFIMAPMVHWPEVMVTYDKVTGTLFSADAFGSFGALSGNLFDSELDFSSKIDEYRRYYTNIVGKYGAQTSSLLKKASNLNIKMICPLHGLIIKENISLITELYSKWANYTPEINSVLIAYASVYGGTQNAAEVLAGYLADMGVKNIKMYDVSKTHSSYILADAFKYSHIVLASTTYNNNIFVNMEHFIKDMVKHNLQNRYIAIIENGSWACNCADAIKAELLQLKNIKIFDNKLTIKSCPKNSQEEEFLALAKEIKNSLS